jgi:nucleotide-binding universal stress UspA family protein
MDFTRNIVVGYDDTTSSLGAARWAADLARSAGSDLRLVHAWTWPLVGYGMTAVPAMDPVGPRNQTLRLLEDAADAVSRQIPEISVRADLLPGNPRDVLDDVSRSADMLVVGTRGLGPVMGALLGSVSRGILHDAGCPVAIIRSDQHLAGPVLVAYDGSDAGREALDVASDLADAWSVTLRVVHVLVDPHASSGSATEVPSARGGSRALLEEAIARIAGRHQRLPVESQVLEGRTVPEVLLVAAAGARILVMGHRGLSRGPFGSTAQATVLHATGNLVVVRRPPSE